MATLSEERKEQARRVLANRILLKVRKLNDLLLRARDEHGMDCILRLPSLDTVSVRSIKYRPEAVIYWKEDN